MERSEDRHDPEQYTIAHMHDDLDCAAAYNTHEDREDSLKMLKHHKKVKYFMLLVNRGYSSRLEQDAPGFMETCYYRVFSGKVSAT